MTGNSPPTLDQPPVNGVAAIHLQERNQATDRRRHHQLRVDRIYLDRVGPAPQTLEFVMTVGERQYAALAQHHVEIELLAHHLVELQRVLKKRSALGPKVVGANYLRIATGVAPTQPPFLQ